MVDLETIFILWPTRYFHCILVHRLQLRSFTTGDACVNTADGEERIFRRSLWEDLNGQLGSLVQRQPRAATEAVECVVALGLVESEAIRKFHFMGKGS